MPLTPRTSETAVAELLDRDYKRGRSLDPFIKSATIVIDRVVKNGPVDNETAELMERWLAAYFYTKSDPTYSQRYTMGAGGQFNRDKNAYLDGAAGIDPTGTLKGELEEGGSASVEWLGKDPSQQIPWYNRN